MASHDYNRSIDASKLSALINTFVTQELKNPQSALFVKMQNDEFFNTLNELAIFEKILLCIASTFYIMTIQRELQQKEETRIDSVKNEKQQQDSMSSQLESELKQTKTESERNQLHDEKIRALLEENARIISQYPAIATWVNYQDSLSQYLTTNFDAKKLVNTNGEGLSEKTINNVNAIIAAPIPIHAIQKLADSNKNVKAIIESKDQVGVKQIIYGCTAMKEFMAMVEIASDGMHHLGDLISPSQILAAIKKNAQLVQKTFGEELVKKVEEGFTEGYRAFTSITSSTDQTIALSSVNVNQNEVHKLMVPDAPSAPSYEAFANHQKRP
jgi:aspartate/glutamate racemase